MHLSQVITKPVRSAVPTFEPVTLAEAKKQCEVAEGIGHHDSHLLTLIEAARELVENDTGIACATGTYTYKLSQWPCWDYFEIPLRPVTAVSSIVYVDTAGTSSTWASSNYTLETSSVQPLVRLTYGNYFPSLRGDINGITVTLVAGYADGSVPRVIKQACLLLIDHWFNNRGIVGQVGGEIAMTYDALVARLGRSTYP